MDIGIPFSSLMLTIAFVGFHYSGAALILYIGFPPFYRSVGSMWFYYSGPHFDVYKKKVVSSSVGYLMLAGGILAFALLSGFHFLLILCLPICLYVGLRIRRHLLQETEGPHLWLVTPLTVKWPMFPFDVWTIGAGLLTLLALGSPWGE
ncbi:MAG: hypothetical protein AAGE89_01945 [Pseudomonadota bacterium]